MKRSNRTAHLLRTRLNVEEDNAVSARVHHQMLIDKVDIALHVRLQSEEVPVAQHIPVTGVRRRHTLSGVSPKSWQQRSATRV